MDFRDFVLMSHAHTHARIPSFRGIQGREEWLCEGIAEADLRLCPDGRHNSIAWLIWHMARCEDVMVNSILRDGSEVLDDGWLPRLGVTTRHIGTGDTMAEVEAFSQQVDVRALRQYRAAVGQATQKWMMDLDFASLDEIVPRSDVERAAQRGAFGERAGWVREAWGDEEHPRARQLSWMVIGHNHSHLGEANVTKSALQYARR